MLDIEKKQDLKKNILLSFAIIIIILFVAQLVFGVVIASDRSDYFSQHIRFIDYIRKNFEYTHDFFPQWLMNYGLGQSFVVLYYYGLYNPYILLSYLLPINNPVYILEFIFALIVLANSAFMTMLLHYHNIKGNLNTVTALLYAFSTVLLYHITVHPMFIYYLPFMTLALVSLHLLVDRNIKSLYIISVALIFYTNFTFAPVILILQFFYYLSVLISNKRLNCKELFQYLSLVIIGVLLGMFILVPTAIESASYGGSRDVLSPIEISIFNPIKKVILYISTSPYSIGLYNVSLAAFIGALLFLRKSKYMVFVIPMIIMLIFMPITYALNIFQYLNSKVYIYYNPLLWVLFASLVKKMSLSKMFVLISVSGIIVIGVSTPYQTLNGVLTILGFSFAILVVYYSKKSLLRYTMVIMLILFNLLNVTHFTSVEKLDSFGIGSDIGELDNYREIDYSNSDKDSNYIDSLGSFSPTVYTSIENGNYIQATRSEYETAIYATKRETSNEAFANPYFQNFFGIPLDGVKTNTIVYGVENNNVMNIKDYDKLTSSERILAVNQAVFSDDGISEQYKSNFDISEIYTIDKQFSLSSDDNYTYKVPEEYQDGILTIQVEVNFENINGVQNISINNLRNQAMLKDSYGLNENKILTFIFDTRDLKELELEVGKVDKNVSYHNLKIYYQSMDDFIENKLNIVEPTDFVVDLNKNFTMNINMESEGKLVTTIPYSDGFRITIDGEEVPLQVVNGLYLGADIEAGDHTVEISYEIPGFRIGLIMAIIGLVILIYTVIQDIGFKNGTLSNK